MAIQISELELVESWKAAVDALGDSVVIEVHFDQNASLSTLLAVNGGEEIDADSNRPMIYPSGCKRDADEIAIDEGSVVVSMCVDKKTLEELHSAISELEGVRALIVFDPEAYVPKLAYKAPTVDS